MFRRLTIFFCLLTFFIYGGLIASLFYFYSGGLFLGILTSDRLLFSLRLSVITATIVSIVSLFFAIPAAYGLSRYRFFGRQLIDTMLELPMIISPVALGALILISLNTPFGTFIQKRGIEIIFTFYGILVAQFVTTLGITTRLIKTVMDEIPVRYEEAAKTLGASPLKVFFTITLPLSKKGIIASGILTWAKALGEFGATITVAGSMAMKTETLPIAIFMRLAGADIEGAAVHVLILIGIGILILYGVRVFGLWRGYT
ncbi:MAG: ABC transporter permease [Syntrophorhabdaceae bacterium]|nr:ABC transporter permease [Syntrophorhabdaceae bacterium]